MFPPRPSLPGAMTIKQKIPTPELACRSGYAITVFSIESESAAPSASSSPRVVCKWRRIGSGSDDATRNTASLRRHARDDRAEHALARIVVHGNLDLVAFAQEGCDGVSGRNQLARAELCET